MEDNKQYLLENLLNDTSFKNWVYKSNRNDTVFWNNWINNNPAYIAIIYTAKDIILGISFKKEELSEDFINQKLDLLFKHIEPNLSKKSITSNKFLPFRRTLITSSLSVFAVALLFFFVFKLINSNNDVIHKTAYGEIINLKLPDGTTVVLNGNSELTYKNDNPRDVTLKGDAYFKVKSKPSTHAKFWVQTEDLKVEVFGTQFNVNTRDEKTNVLLDEGSIQLLFDNGLSKKMKPGEIVSYTKGDEKILHEKVNANLKYALWRDGTYIFNNLTLEEVMRNIEHAYGISSDFSNKELKSIIITGGIPNENLKICLSAIEKSTGTKIIINDNTLLILNN
tara:strand:- start:161020 stop:162030 length:1011 start_codon:yes stop_codon:yes gene_type:complete